MLVNTVLGFLERYATFVIYFSFFSYSFIIKKKVIYLVNNKNCKFWYNEKSSMVTTFIFRIILCTISLKNLIIWIQCVMILWRSKKLCEKLVFYVFSNKKYCFCRSFFFCIQPFQKEDIIYALNSFKTMNYKLVVKGDALEIYGIQGDQGWLLVNKVKDPWVKYQWISDKNFEDITKVKSYYFLYMFLQ